MSVIDEVAIKIQENNILKGCIESEIKLKIYKKSEEDIKKIKKELNEIDPTKIEEYLYLNFNEDIQNKILHRWDKKLEKKLRKHGIDPDRMLETAKKLIKAHERKLLREAKPKYKH